MHKQVVTEISAAELSAYDGTVCPSCEQGSLVQELEHDAVGGNATVLRCVPANACGHKIIIKR